MNLVTYKIHEDDFIEQGVMADYEDYEDYLNTHLKGDLEEFFDVKFDVNIEMSPVPLSKEHDLSYEVEDNFPYPEHQIGDAIRLCVEDINCEFVETLF